MILVGNQRSGARNLAAHLLKDENEHVSVHELRGFVADDLTGALREVEAVSRGTRCKQYLFSLSLNPPPSEQVRTEAFEAAIDRAEDRLGLNGQPRAVVFHEKEGRRHAHAVWSRIDGEAMKAVPLPYTRNALQEVSRELYLEHGWQMPKGLADRSRSDPKNYSLEEWQQCKRQGRDPQAVKTAIQDAWSISDSRDALAHALEERGFTLARGDRRGYVALDHQGEPYALARYAGVKTKAVRERLGDAETLPSIADAKNRIAAGMIPAMERLQAEAAAKGQGAQERFEAERSALVARQRAERTLLKRQQEERHWQEARERQTRFRPGLPGLWDHLTGEHKRISRENERAAYAALMKKRAQTDALILNHIDQRKALTTRRDQDRERAEALQRALREDRERYMAMQAPKPKQAFERTRQPNAPPDQHAISDRHKAALERLRRSRDIGTRNQERDGPDISH